MSPLHSLPRFAQAAFLVLGLLASTAIGTDEQSVGSAAPKTTAVSSDFPRSWFGRWKGDAANDNGSGEPVRFTMELVIGPTEQADRFQWTIVYDGAFGRQERKYELVVKDAARGEYAIDEKNSIVLDARLLSGALYSHFAVDGTRLTVRERLEGLGSKDERIEVEMITTVDAEANTSGKGNGAPEVLSWMPRSILRATLRRVAEPAPTAPAAPADASTFR
jgi:hypothetical protein